MTKRAVLYDHEYQYGEPELLWTLKRALVATCPHAITPRW